MNKKPYAQILDAVAHDQIPSGRNLAPSIISRIQKRKGFRMQPTTKLISAIVLIAIAFAILFFGAPAVAAAIGRWFGYVPGVGLVREGQVRVLAEPVSVTRDGVTVTVDQVVLNQEQTAMLYTVDGIPAAAQIAKGLEPEKQCDYIVSLRLPDGTPLLASPTGIQFWEAGYQHRFNYKPIPADVREATLVIPCLFHTRPGAAPENWEIPLRFVPAPPDMTALPVIDIPTPTPPAATTTAQASPTGSPSADPTQAGAQTPPEAQNTTEASLRLTLDRAVQMEDGYLLYATLHWEDTPYTTVELPNLVETLHLRDGSGQELLYEEHYDENTGLNYDKRQTVFAIKTAPVQNSGPLTVVIDWVITGLPVEASFVIDPGAAPQPGQEWQPDIPLQLGEHSLRVRKVTIEVCGNPADPATNIMCGYSIDMTSTSGIQYAMLGDPDHPVVSGVDGASGTNGDETAFFSAFNYADGLPAGPVTVRIGGIAVKHTQTLTAQWTPPAVSPVQLPTQPAACLTAQAWKAALAQPAALPADLPGKVLVYSPADPNNPNGAWELAIVAPDGSGRKPIPGASDGAFSPDGTRLAYSKLETGIAIMDLATGESTPLPGTGNGDFNPVWSPDGKQLVFNRGMGVFDLFITNPDGTQMRALTEGGVQEWPVGWLPDGSFLYTVPGRENENTVYRLDLQTMQREEYSGANSDSVSPDGKHILIMEPTFGDRWLVSISDLDGSNRWLVGGTDLWVTNPVWSPDGEWLLASVSANGPGEGVWALINLRTCQVTAVKGLKGTIHDWTK